MTVEKLGMTTSCPDPWSEYANWVSAAAEVRREWMRMMGLDEHEIEEQCAHDPPTNFDEELSEYNAMFSIREMNERLKQR